MSEAQLEEMAPQNTNSIFLAGPCIRSKHYGLFPHWRDIAIEYFEKQGFDGDIFSPEPFCVMGYHSQILWEMAHLKAARVILFWIPRELNILPAFTSNIEYGEWMRSGKVVLGYPENAVKMGYLTFKAEQYDIPVTDTLEKTVDESIDLANRIFTNHTHVWDDNGVCRICGNELRSA